MQRSRSNDFKYNEQIIAGYFSLSTEDLLGSKIKAQAGLRSEYTLGESFLIRSNAKKRQHYRDWFPSIFFSKEIAKKSSLSVSYSKRIGRPNYMSLNPGIYYVSEYSGVSGNPDLKPEYIHALELGYDYGKIIGAALSYSYTKSKINDVIILSQGENTIYQVRNLKKEETYGLRINTQNTLTSWWKLLSKLELIHQSYKGHFTDTGTISNANNYFRGKLSQQFPLPEDYKLEFSGDYISKRVDGQFSMDAVYYFSLSLSKEFKNGISVNINVHDIFNTIRERFNSKQTEMQSFVDRFPYQRAFSFSLRYHLRSGEKTRKVEFKNTSKEENDRAS